MLNERFSHKQVHQSFLFTILIYRVINDDNDRSACLPLSLDDRNMTPFFPCEHVRSFVVPTNEQKFIDNRMSCKHCIDMSKFITMTERCRRIRETMLTVHIDGNRRSIVVRG
jgi:hypothetical protein